MFIMLNFKGNIKGRLMFYAKTMQRDRIYIRYVYYLLQGLPAASHPTCIGTPILIEFGAALATVVSGKKTFLSAVLLICCA